MRLCVKWMCVYVKLCMCGLGAVCMSVPACVCACMCVCVCICVCSTLKHCTNPSVQEKQIHPRLACDSDLAHSTIYIPPSLYTIQLSVSPEK